jgi:hypothetical protein
MDDLNLAVQAEWWAQDKPNFTSEIRRKSQVSRLSPIDRQDKWSHSMFLSHLRLFKIHLETPHHLRLTILKVSLKSAPSKWEVPMQLQSSRKIAIRAIRLLTRAKNIQVLANLVLVVTFTIRKNLIRRWRIDRCNRLLIVMIFSFATIEMSLDINRIAESKNNSLGLVASERLLHLLYTARARDKVSLIDKRKVMFN